MWKKLQYWIRDSFAFSHRETQAFVPLLLLMALVLASPFAWQAWVADSTVTDSPSDQARLDSLVSALESRQPVRQPRTGYSSAGASAPAGRLFAFDPNVISSAQWQQLGLRSYLADRIVKYRAKGGKFRVKKDLLKIYSFPTERYAVLQPYILLPDTLPRSQTFAKNFSEKSPAFVARPDFRPQPFDLNTVDTVALEKLRGIGPALARRIVQYRERLGGFVQLGQLHEVYGLDSATVTEVLKYGSLREKGALRRLHVNTATVAELRHPYLSPRLAALIVAYRQQHGPFTDAQSLTKIKLMDAATLQKLEPYLAF